MNAAIKVLEMKVKECNAILNACLSEIELDNLIAVSAHTENTLAITYAPLIAITREQLSEYESAIKVINYELDS